MRVVRMMSMVGMAMVVSGCAMGGTRQDLARLQSQVGLLDERVAQLERSSFGGSSAASLGETTTASRTATEPNVSKSSSVSVKVSTISSTKPTTREIQQALKNAGFYQGPIDGKMGPQTHDAIKEFQRIHGLTDDGVVGKQTWAKLRSYADLSSGSGELNAAEPLK